MKTIKAMSIAAVAALSLMSAASFAQSMSVTTSTLDGAEAQLAAQAKQNGEHYRGSAEKDRPLGGLFRIRTSLLSDEKFILIAPDMKKPAYAGNSYNTPLYRSSASIASQASNTISVS